jgi:hypothetical protein
MNCGYAGCEEAMEFAVARKAVGVIPDVPNSTDGLGW